MSAELAEVAPAEPGDGPPRLSRWVTGVALGILGVLAVLIFWPAHGLDTLDRPEQSLERVVGSDMDFRAAARTAPGWERRLHRLAFASDASARADALAWYDELVREEGSPLAELCRITLLAEDGQTEALEAAVTTWAPGDDWARRLATWARAAYEAEPPPPEELRTALAAVRRELPSGWFADRLAARLASRLGDAAAAAEAEARHRRAGHPAALASPRHPRRRDAARRARTGGARRLARRPGRPWIRVATAPIPPRWTAADGVGLFARGAVGLVGVAVVWPLLPDAGWSTLLVAVLQTIPLGIFLVLLPLLVEDPRRHVRTPRSAGIRSRPRAGHPRVAGVLTLADVLIELGGTRVGVADALYRRLPGAARVGTPGEVAADVLDTAASSRRSWRSRRSAGALRRQGRPRAGAGDPR